MFLFDIGSDSMLNEKRQNPFVEYFAINGLVEVTHQGDKCIRVEDSLRHTVSRRI